MAKKKSARPAETESYEEGAFGHFSISADNKSTMTLVVNSKQEAEALLADIKKSKNITGSPGARVTFTPGPNYSGPAKGTVVVLGNKAGIKAAAPVAQTPAAKPPTPQSKKPVRKSKAAAKTKAAAKPKDTVPPPPSPKPQPPKPVYAVIAYRDPDKKIIRTQNVYSEAELTAAKEQFDVDKKRGKWGANSPQYTASFKRPGAKKAPAAAPAAVKATPQKALAEKIDDPADQDPSAEWDPNYTGGEQTAVERMLRKNALKRKVAESRKRTGSDPKGVSMNRPLLFKVATARTLALPRKEKKTVGGKVYEGTGKAPSGETPLAKSEKWHLMSPKNFVRNAAVRVIEEAIARNKSPQEAMNLVKQQLQAALAGHTEYVDAMMKEVHKIAGPMYAMATAAPADRQAIAEKLRERFPIIKEGVIHRLTQIAQNTREGRIVDAYKFDPASEQRIEKVGSPGVKEQSAQFDVPEVKVPDEDLAGLSKEQRAFLEEPEIKTLLEELAATRSTTNPRNLRGARETTSDELLGSKFIERTGSKSGEEARQGFNNLTLRGQKALQAIRKLKAGDEEANGLLAEWEEELRKATTPGGFDADIKRMEEDIIPTLRRGGKNKARLERARAELQQAHQRTGFYDIKELEEEIVRLASEIEKEKADKITEWRQKGDKTKPMKLNGLDPVKALRLKQAKKALKKARAKGMKKIGTIDGEDVLGQVRIKRLQNEISQLEALTEARGGDLAAVHGLEVELENMKKGYSPEQVTELKNKIASLRSLGQERTTQSVTMLKQELVRRFPELALSASFSTEGLGMDEKQMKAVREEFNQRLEEGLKAGKSYDDILEEITKEITEEGYHGKKSPVLKSTMLGLLAGSPYVSTKDKDGGADQHGTFLDLAAKSKADAEKLPLAEALEGDELVSAEMETAKKLGAKGDPLVNQMNREQETILANEQGVNRPYMVDLLELRRQHALNPAIGMDREAVIEKIMKELPLESMALHLKTKNPNSPDSLDNPEKVMAAFRKELEDLYPLESYKESPVEVPPAPESLAAKAESRVSSISEAGLHNLPKEWNIRSIADVARAPLEEAKEILAQRLGIEGGSLREENITIFKDEQGRWVFTYPEMGKTPVILEHANQIDQVIRHGGTEEELLKKVRGANVQAVLDQRLSEGRKSQLKAAHLNDQIQQAEQVLAGMKKEKAPAAAISQQRNLLKQLRSEAAALSSGQTVTPGLGGAEGKVGKNEGMMVADERPPTPKDPRRWLKGEAGQSEAILAMVEKMYGPEAAQSVQKYLSTPRAPWKKGDPEPAISSFPASREQGMVQAAMDRLRRINGLVKGGIPGAGPQDPQEALQEAAWEREQYAAVAEQERRAKLAVQVGDALKAEEAFKKRSVASKNWRTAKVAAVAVPAAYLLMNKVFGQREDDLASRQQAAQMQLMKMTQPSVSDVTSQALLDHYRMLNQGMAYSMFPGFQQAQQAQMQMTGMMQQQQLRSMQIQAKQAQLTPSEQLIGG